MAAGRARRAAALRLASALLPLLLTRLLLGGRGRAEATSFEEAEGLEGDEWEELDEASFFWYNENTGESSWLHPLDGYQDSDGRTYYLNPSTGMTQWELPVELAWEIASSPEHGRDYYHNKVTGDRIWDRPDVLAWRKVYVEEPQLTPDAVGMLQSEPDIYTYDDYPEDEGEDGQDGYGYDVGHKAEL